MRSIISKIRSTLLLSKLLIGLLPWLLILGCTTNQNKHIGLQPYGSFDLKKADSIAQTLHKIYGFTVTILPPLEIPNSCFVNIKSPRYRADLLIKQLKKEIPDSLDYIMGLLNKDISTTKKDRFGNTLKPISKYEDWGVFGLGYRPGKSSVVSLYRYQNSKPEKLLERLKKICTHELGHNLGLAHCEDKNCVMTDAAETIKTIDNVELALCKKCRGKI